MSAGISDQRMKGQGNQGMFGPSFGQQSSYNYFPNNGENYNKNAWDSQQQVNGAGRRGYDDYYRGNDKRAYGNDGVKSIEHGMQGMGLERGNDQRDSYSASAKTNSQSNTSSATGAKESSAPKKMTWASIASQPAKAQTRTSSTATTLGKKMKGMPPPPMVPGKHNLDIGTWESEKNGSALVPPVPVPSPPPIIDEPSPFVQSHASKSNHNNANNANSNNNSNNPNSNNNPSQSNAGANSGMNQHGRNDSGQYERGPSHYNNREYRDRGDRDQHRGDQRDGGGYMNRQNWNQNRGNGYHNNSGHYQPHHRSYGPNQDRQDRHMNYNDNRNSHYQQSSYGQSHRPQYQSNFQHQNRPNRSHSPQQQFQSGPERGSGPPPEPNVPEVNVDAEPVVEQKVEVEEPVIETLLDKNNYNPPEMDMDGLDTARFFVIKSYSEDDIHRSIKYEIWCSTEHGNKRLDQAFRDAEREGGKIFLLFSVNGSGHFCGVAQMMTAVDYDSVSSVWHQDKWKGKFSLKWVYVKDVPNSQLRHIRLENNENKSVTNSRDTQEVPNAQGQQVLEILHSYKHSTSIFDDFIHYERLQVDGDTKRDGPEGDDRGHRPMPPSYHSGGQYHRNEGGYDNRGRNNYGNYQGGNRSGGYHHNNYENRRNDDYHQRGNNYDRPQNRDYNNRREGGFGGNNYDRPQNRDYNRREGGGFMSRDRGGEEADFSRENRYENRERMERSDDHHSGGGFKRNNSNNFGNRGSNHSGGSNSNSGYRN